MARQLAQEVADEIARQASGHSDPVEALPDGRRPGRARLRLLEAPAALGASR